MDKNFNEVTDRIIMMSGIDIFKNTRVNEYIEVRALTCFILHKKLHMGYSKIARNFKSNGKKMDHATVIHAVKRYPIYRSTNNKLKMMESCFKIKKMDLINYKEIDQIIFLQEKCKKIQKKNRELKKNIHELSYNKVKFTTDEEKLLMMFDGLSKVKVEEVIDKINLLKKSWVWKSKEVKDRCEIIEASTGLSDRAY